MIKIFYLLFILILTGCFERDSKSTDQDAGSEGVSARTQEVETTSEDESEDSEEIVIDEGEEIADPPEATPTGPITITSTPQTTAQTGDEITYQVVATSSTNLVLTYSLSNAPIGMRIREKTGKLTWTPVTGQSSSGAVTITVTDTDSNTETQTLNITVTTKALTFNGFFVSTDGTDAKASELSDLASDDSPRRDPTKPFNDLKDACEVAKPGDNIYFRGGIYQNKDYGTGNLNNGDMWRPTCTGIDGSPITLRPWGNEQVKFQFDGYVGITLFGSHIIVENFEFEGVAQKITFKEAYEHWWVRWKYYNGGGIVMKGDHITFRNNVVHDCPSAGINAKFSGDYITIENNIAYNNAWWTIHGVHGITIQDTSKTDGSTTTNMRVIGNLSFNNESRIFSRVWSKGFAELIIDEGAGLHVQINAEDYQGRYLLEHNFVFFNGKAMTINTTDHVDFNNNTLYGNGTTVNSVSQGLQAQSSNDVTFSRNAAQATLGGKAYVMMGGMTPATVDNYIIGIDNPLTLPAGVNLVTKIFNDPANLDFSIDSGLPQTIGADKTYWDKLMLLVNEYGIEIKPTGWPGGNNDRALMETLLQEMTKGIIDSRPAGATVEYDKDCAGNSDTNKVCIKNIPPAPPEDTSRPSQIELHINHKPPSWPTP